MTARLHLWSNLDATSLVAYASSPFMISFLGFVTLYHFTAPLYSTSKQTSWILTTVSSAIMTIASIPFMWDYIVGGGNVRQIRHLPGFTIAMNRFFQAYLAADLTIGMMYYRIRISLIEGWIHHLMYLTIVELAIRRSWPHIFCFCAFMELPTLILGFTTLYPRFRSNVLFAALFFFTRIIFHVILVISYLYDENRAQATGGSFVPAGVLLFILPLHVMWFAGCIKGFIRRETRKRMPGPPSVITLDISSAPTTSMKDTFSPSRHENLLRIPQAPRYPVQNSPPQKRGIVALESVTWQIQLSETIFTSLPPRETVFDYVGLGRPMKVPQSTMVGRGERIGEFVPYQDMQRQSTK